MSTNPSRVLKLPEVMSRTGLGRDTVYRLARTNQLGFPAPFKISGRASGWLESEISSFISSRVAERDGGAK